ncbi:hypothetical protein [Nonomuraea rubra]|uniref:hypothetical protein n=1 Tax=Nonomuraea rubra TaxID=46180 RepID=UPI0031E66B12
MGLKIVADIADASATVDLGPLRAGVPVPAGGSRGPSPILLGPAALDAEHDMLTRRLDLAREYARAHGLNRVTAGARNTTLGVLASGATYAVVERALEDLGLDAEEAGLRADQARHAVPRRARRAGRDDRGPGQGAGRRGQGAVPGGAAQAGLVRRRAHPGRRGPRAAHRPRHPGRRRRGQGHRHLPRPRTAQEGGPAARPAAGGGGAHPVLLLGLPAQHLHPPPPTTRWSAWASAATR